jgi:hypothetical protein
MPGIPASPVTWDYAYLIGIVTTATGYTLFCGLDADINAFSVECPKQHWPALAPFVELLEARRSCPAAVEPPLVPYVLDGMGRAVFCLEGAEHDYPPPRTLS